MILSILLSQLQKLKILQPININKLVLNTFQFLIKIFELIVNLVGDKFRYIFIIIILIIPPYYYNFTF